MRALITAIFLLACVAPAKASPIPLLLDQRGHAVHGMPFIPRHSPGYALALNVPYAPVKALREALNAVLGTELRFFTGWDPAGEAHVTVITPPEWEILSTRLCADEVDAIALMYGIQRADLRILGLGSGKAMLEDKEEQTFFLIAESLTLRWIRLAVHKAYVAKGGNPADWDPSWYFPHVTVGFTKTDLHEQQGVIKNVKHSWDARFELLAR